MTVKEKLIEEFTAAIIAIYGDNAEKEVEEGYISEGDIESIARKVKFYLF